MDIIYYSWVGAWMALACLCSETTNKTEKTPTMMILRYNTVYMLNGYKIKHIILLGFPHLFIKNRYFRQL